MSSERWRWPTSFWTTRRDKPRTSCCHDTVDRGAREALLELEDSARALLAIGREAVVSGCSWRGGALVSDVEVKPSGIEGIGVFATRSFRADDRIRRVNVIREITPDAPIREELGERVDHCSYPDGKVVLWGFPDRHVNHSCDPNAWVAYERLVVPRGTAGDCGRRRDHL